MEHEAFDILRTLNKKEFHDFCYFIDSPYFNRDSNVSSLFAVLKRFYPDFKQKILTDSFVMTKTGITKKSSLRVYFLRLRNLLIEFLTFNYLEQEKLIKFIYELDELESRNLPCIYNKQRDKWLRFFNNPKRKFETLDYLHLYQFYLVEYNMFGTLACEIKKGKYSDVVKYQNRIGTSLTYFYLLESLKDWIQVKWQNDAVSRKETTLKTFFEEGKKTEELFRSVINEEKNQSRRKVLRLYFLIYKCYSENSNELEVSKNIKKLLTLINSLPSNLSQYEKEYITSVSRNATVRFTNKICDIELEYEINEIYLKTFSQNKNSTIPKITFSHIFFNALKDDRPAWAAKILKEYGDFIDSALYEFSRSALNFYQCYKSANYNEAGEILLKLKTKDIYTKRHIKLLQIYLHFDMEDFSFVQRLADNLKKYIYNHSKEFSEAYIKGEYDFCNLIQLLCNYKMHPSKELLLKLKSHAIAERSVFMQRKIAELTR